LDFSNDINLEDIFERNGKDYFWIFLHKVGKQFVVETVKRLRQSPCTYLCEGAFSALTAIKKRSSLKSVDICMRIALSNTEPHFKKIVKEK